MLLTHHVHGTTSSAADITRFFSSMENLFDTPLEPLWPGTEMPLASLYPYLMHPYTPVSIAAAYVALVLLFNPDPSASKPSRMQSQGSDKVRQWDAMTLLVLVHNTILCVYSAWSFVGTMGVLVKSAQMYDTTFDWACDTSDLIWTNGLYYYGYIFYISKYYELIDTLIIILKKRRGSLLQVYHHAGVILCMYVLVRTRGMPTFIIVILNSFIHTIMYFYYAVTCLGIRVPGKQYLTSLQILQFLVGTVGAGTYIGVQGCMNDLQKAATAFNIAYVLVLIYLFNDFAKRTYGTPKSVTNGKKIE
jgi:hypothetical protein